MAEGKQLQTNVNERVSSYTAADGQEVRLSPEMIRKYLVQGKGELVTLQEMAYFINICKARKLNPLTRDCYLIKYGTDPAAIVTSIDFFRKRARAQKDCKGWKKGVMVQDKEGKLRDSFGLVKDDEKLVGGWFEAKPEGWLEPFRLEVNLKGYLKKTSEGKITKFWSEENQPTMIAKVAEAQGLRTIWPDEFQQLYEEDEVRTGPGDAIPGMSPPIDVTDNGNNVKTFEDTIPEGTDFDLLSDYVNAVAKATKKTVEEVQANAVKEPEGFWKMFPAWSKTQQKKTGKKPQADAGSGSGKVEMCPAPCPDRPDTVMTVAFCNIECKTRQDCPAWPVEYNGADNSTIRT